MHTETKTEMQWLVICLLATLVYLIENSKFHGCYMSFPFLTTNFYRNYFLNAPCPPVRCFCSRNQFLWKFILRKNKVVRASYSTLSPIQMWQNHRTTISKDRFIATKNAPPVARPVFLQFLRWKQLWKKFNVSYDNCKCALLFEVQVTYVRFKEELRTGSP